MSDSLEKLPGFFESHVLHAAKDFDYAHEYEDAFHVDPQRGLASISDGVASGMFSQQWARLLVKAAAEAPPEMYDPASFPAWLAQLRQAWYAEISQKKLSYGQQMKLRQVGGGFATLLWIELYPVDPVDGVATQFRLRAFAVGDSCLFHYRDGVLLRSFPLTTVEEFEADPISVCSVDKGRDHVLEFQVYDDTCLAGDLLVLATDAVAKWAVGQREAGTEVDWSPFLAETPESWQTWLNDRRVETAMRRDDSTLILLRVTPLEIHDAPAEPITESPAPMEDAPQDAPETDFAETSPMEPTMPGDEFDPYKTAVIEVPAEALEALRRTMRGEAAAAPAPAPAVEQPAADAPATPDPEADDLHTLPA